MKKIVLTLIVLIGATTLYSQDAIDTYFSQYVDSEEYTKISISGKMFELFTHLEVEDENDQELLETIANIEGMRMLVNDGSENANTDGKSLYKNAIKKPSGAYEVLMTVEDGEEDLTFFIKESNGIIAELLLIGGGEKEFFVMSLVGDIDLKQISKLSRSLDIDGMEHLNKIENKD